MSHVVPSGDGSQLRLRVVRTQRELESEKGRWESLFDRCTGVRTPFLSYDWICAWSESYELDGRLYVILVEDADRVVGIMPLVEHRWAIGPLGLKTLETLAGQSRNVVALVEPGSEEPVAGVVAQHLLDAVLLRGRCLRLTLVPRGEQFLEVLKAALMTGASCARLSERVVARAPYVPLPTVWEDYWKSLSPRRRKVLRWARNALAREHVVSFETHHGDSIPSALEELYRIHQHRWNQAALRGLFHDPASRAFHNNMAVRLDRTGMLQLTSMYLDGHSASVHIVLVLDGVAYFLRSGRDTELSRYSIGHIHDLHLLKQAIDSGLREADYLRGAEPYKFYWTQRYRCYVELVVSGRVGAFPMPAVVATAWLRAAQFLSHSHTPHELIQIIRIRWRESRERRRMGIDL